MKRKPVERKPSWLRAFAPPGNLAKLEATVCEGCGRWVIVQQLGVWDTYDAGIIQGDDLTVAIILGRRLTCIKWNEACRQPTLVDVCGMYGISPGGQYLVEHVCGFGRISDRPFTPPRRSKKASETFPCTMSRKEGDEFARLWRMPLNELSKRKPQSAEPIGAVGQQSLF